MHKKPLITIVIATFNSEKTLPIVLKSIGEQTFPKDDREVLIIDGGSKDKTKHIASDFGCKVINNPRTEPVYAKFLGFTHALGRYIVYLDHDEVIINKESLQMKYNAIVSNHSKIVLGSGYVTPANTAFINNYINEFGDPFSFFIYRLTKDARFFIQTMMRRYSVVKETKEYVLFDLSNIKNIPLIEVCAIGSMTDREYIMKEFPDTAKDPSLIPHFFYLVYEKNKELIITKNDGLYHYSSDTFSKYLNKIRWRVKNNIYHVTSMGQAGFEGRTSYMSAYTKYKKYLFIPYAYFCISFFDALWLVITRRKLLYFIHIVLCIYTANLIIYHSCLKLLGKIPKLKSYDESIEVKEE